MRVRWIIYALELAALVAMYVLIGIAFGWAIGLVFGAGFVVFAALSWAVAKLIARQRS
jgi:hypothetical protein